VLRSARWETRREVYHQSEHRRRFSPVFSKIAFPWSSRVDAEPERRDHSSRCWLSHALVRGDTAAHPRIRNELVIASTSIRLSKYHRQESSSIRERACRCSPLAPPDCMIRHDRYIRDTCGRYRATILHASGTRALAMISRAASRYTLHNFASYVRAAMVPAGWERVGGRGGRRSRELPRGSIDRYRSQITLAKSKKDAPREVAC
jgi:hypothetical protein